MDQNVIFIYPLNKILFELKAELAKDSTLTLFDVDMVEEYQQLITNVSSSFTISSDLKKTIKILEINRNTLIKKSHFNLLVSKDIPSSLVLSKMEKNGLNEALPDYTKLKVLQKKVDSFFRMMENFITEDPYRFLEESKKPKIGDPKLERLTNDIKILEDRPKRENLDRQKKEKSEENSPLEDSKRQASTHQETEGLSKKSSAAYEGEVQKKKNNGDGYRPDQEVKKTNSPENEFDYDRSKKTSEGADEADRAKEQLAYEWEGPLKKKHQAYEDNLKKDDSSGLYNEEKKKPASQSSYEDLYDRENKNTAGLDVDGVKKDHGAAGNDIKKKKNQHGVELDYTREKKAQAGFHATSSEKKAQAFEQEKKKKLGEGTIDEKSENNQKIKLSQNQEKMSENLSTIGAPQSEHKISNHTRDVDFEKFPEALLPETVFYPPQKILDPVAFFIEILLGNWKPEDKKKYFKMSLYKVYQTRIYICLEDGTWEEGTPPSLKEVDLSIFDKPCWINEAKNRDENYFVLPVAFNDKVVGALGLVVPGKLNNQKMSEMEFWCYLGRCLWN